MRRHARALVFVIIESDLSAGPKSLEHAPAAARVAGRFPQRWLREYIRAKLRSDPMYPAVFELLRMSAAPTLDVGCGVGLLAFYLRERGINQEFVGFDCDARKIELANRTARDFYPGVKFFAGNVEDALPDFTGNIALLDLLHYLPRASQRILLERVAAALAPSARAIIRETPKEAKPRYWATWLAEAFAQRIAWNISLPLNFPSRAEIHAPFENADFRSEERPLWGHTPFNNHLFLFERVASATFPARE